jgi:hypothetical protein
MFWSEKMSWKRSRFRAGDYVEVRSREEILATLDASGCIDGLPFMPEMLQFCGRRLHVAAVAHKTCDTARQTWKGRRLNRTVHLNSTRCSGADHGGCDAECNLFWKDVWLKKVGEVTNISKEGKREQDFVCGEETLRRNTVRKEEASADARLYSCQATEMYNATESLAWWDLRQYVFDIKTGNHSARRVARTLFLAALRKILPRIPFGYRMFERFLESMHLRLTGRPSPRLEPELLDALQTPTRNIGLNPGEAVRIKEKKEIEATLGKKGKNRGLSFDPEEMAPYCGRIVTVKKAVKRIIDEPTGKMQEMKQPCIMLEGVVCRGEYARERLNCPRAIPSYWREIWLERVQEKEPNHSR